MSFEYNRLRGRIVEKYGDQKRFAQAIGLSERTLSLKMNNKLFWKQDEIMSACQLLEIGVSDISHYFFEPKVQKI